MIKTHNPILAFKVGRRPRYYRDFRKVTAEWYCVHGTCTFIKDTDPRISLPWRPFYVRTLPSSSKSVEKSAPQEVVLFVYIVVHAHNVEHFSANKFSRKLLTIYNQVKSEMQLIFWVNVCCDPYSEDAWRYQVLLHFHIFIQHFRTRLWHRWIKI